MKNREKLCSKTCCSGTSNFERFLFDFGCILGSKNRSKIDIFPKNGGSKVVSETLLLSSCFLDGFWSPLEAFWVGLGDVWGWFGEDLGKILELRTEWSLRVEGLTLMIRATSSRSTERQRDRETRPEQSGRQSKTSGLRWFPMTSGWVA